MGLPGSAWGYDGLSIGGSHFRNDAAYLIDRGDQLIGAVFSGFKTSQQATPSNSVQVGPGRLVVPSTKPGELGAYEVYNDAAANSPAITATSTNGRIDRVILRVTSGVPAFETVQGTAAGTPTIPAITGFNYLPLYRIVLPPSTTNITDGMLVDERVFGGKWAQPWGIVPGGNLAITATATNGAGSGAVAGLAVTKPTGYPSNRLIEVTTGAHLIDSAGSGITLAVYLAQNASQARGLTVTLGGSLSSYSGFEISYTFTTVDSAQTWQLYTFTTGTAVSINASSVNPAFIRAKDIGPAGNPLV